MARLGRADRRADAAAARPPARRAAAERRSSTAPRPVLRGLAPVDPLARRGRRRSARGVQGEREEIDELRRSPPTRRAGKPLRQLLQTLDDRSRAIETTRARRLGAAAAPDPTAPPNGQGFTAWSRSSTTSTGRRWRSTRSTSSATSCASCSVGPVRARTRTPSDDDEQGTCRALQLLARPVPARHHRRPTRPRTAGAARDQAARRKQERATASAAPASPRRRPAAGPARPVEAADRAAAGRPGAARQPDRSCRQTPQPPTMPQLPARAGAPASPGRPAPSPQTRSSTSSWRHETPPRNSLDRRQPGAGRRRDAC